MVTLQYIPEKNNERDAVETIKHRLNTYTSTGWFTDNQEHAINISNDALMDLQITNESFTRKETKYNIAKQEVLDKIRETETHPMYIAVLDYMYIQHIDDYYFVYIEKKYSNIQNVTGEELLELLEKYLIFKKLTSVQLMLLKESLTGKILTKSNDYLKRDIDAMLMHGALTICLMNDDFDNKKEVLALTKLGDELLEIKKILDVDIGTHYD